MLLELLQAYFKSISYLSTQIKLNLFQVLLPYSTLPSFSSIPHVKGQIPISSYTLQQCLVFNGKKKLRKISKVSISKVGVKKMLLHILRIFWCLAVLSFPAPPALVAIKCTQKLLNVQRKETKVQVNTPLSGLHSKDLHHHNLFSQAFVRNCSWKQE